MGEIKERSATLLVSIAHVTRYSLAAPANYSIQCLRLTPPSFDAQQVVSWTIEMPHIDEAVRFRDCFGNIAHLVVLPEEHREIAIVARGTVETRDRAGVARGLVEIAPAPRLQARDAADRARCGDPRAQRRHRRRMTPSRACINSWIRP